MSATRCRLYEKGWVYVPHDRTDIRILFERVRAELAKQAEPKAANVRPMKARAK